METEILTSKAVWKWYGHAKSIKIKEYYRQTEAVERYDYSLYVTKYSRNEIDYFAMFFDLFDYQQQLTGCKKTKNITVEITYDFLRYPHKMTAFVQSSDIALSPVVIWSLNNSEQEKSKQTFAAWCEIEKYYKHITQQIEQAKIKEERRKKRELNDPDNPAARKRKARRHLQNLGFDLHKSRKVATTIDDKGKYQIVRLGTGEVIAGATYDLTLEQVEEFYMNLDYEQRTFAAYYNREPNFEKRKNAVLKALKKHGYTLEIAMYRKESYGEKCYCLLHCKSKRHVCKEDGDMNFTLSEVERFIADYPSKTYKRKPF